MIDTSSFYTGYAKHRIRFYNGVFTFTQRQVWPKIILKGIDTIWLILHLPQALYKI